VPELGPLGSVRGALSNERPYRDLTNALPKLAFEVWPEFPFILERLAIRDFSRLSCQRVTVCNEYGTIAAPLRSSHA
jgi:hypothetical protein